MDAPRYPEFAAKLRSARLRSGKTQEQIAVEVGTSRRHWIRWEQGAHLPSAEFMKRIGEATGQPALFAAEIDDEEARLVAHALAALRPIMSQLDEARTRQIVRDELARKRVSA